eukprot:1233761-Rhodomonas_salina.1
MSVCLAMSVSLGRVARGQAGEGSRTTTTRMRRSSYAMSGTEIAYGAGGVGEEGRVKGRGGEGEEGGEVFFSREPLRGGERGGRRRRGRRRRAQAGGGRGG